jgi:O-antigen/teichoic acid export membrane protein
MSATTAHRFAEYNALGDKERLSAYVAHAINWTFWPSLAATIALLAFGKPLLWLFGPQFVAGYDIMFVAAIGLVVRAAIGPVERLLNMLGHQRICALAYALAFAMNVALCVMLVPSFGGHGAAAATSTSLTFETVLLFWIARRRLFTFWRSATSSLGCHLFGCQTPPRESANLLRSDREPFCNAERRCQRILPIEGKSL